MHIKRGETENRELRKMLFDSINEKIVVHNVGCKKTQHARIQSSSLLISTVGTKFFDNRFLKIRHGLIKKN